MTAKTLENQLSLSSKPVLCMVMTFLGHANQEAHSIRKTNIAMLLTKDLYPLAKYVTILSEWLFGDDIKAQQKAFKVDKTYFEPERTFDRQASFPKQKLKKLGEISKMPRKSIQEVEREIDETAIQENHELEKKESKYKET